MKCQNCNVAVGQQFSHAIQNNQCPACGKPIMEQVKLASYLGLKTLLHNNFPTADAEKIATLVVANFELKQLFKEELTDGVSEDIVVEEEIDPDVLADEESKVKQKAEAKDILQKMRQEALDEAEADHWGLGNANGLVSDDGITHEDVNRMKQNQSAENIASGARGSFSRG